MASLFLILGAAHLSAALLVNESFDYVDGNLSGQNGGTGFTGAWSVSGSGTITETVAGGLASLSGNSGTATASRTFSSAITSAGTSSFYFSFDVDVTALGSAVLSGSHSFSDTLSFLSGSTVFSTSMFMTSSGYRLREAYNGGSTTAYINGNSTTTGVTYTVVGAFTFDTGAGEASLTIWLNPTSQASTSVTYTWTSTVTSITGISLARSDGFNVASGTTTTFDNIRVGTDWNSVTSSSVPEPASCAVLLGLAVAGLTVATRRRF